MKTNLRSKLPVALILIGLVLAGCTQVVVTRVPASRDNGAPAEGDTAVGIRYSLPKPVVQITPQADGSVAAEIIMLPDDDNTYAIHAESHVATHTLTVGVEKGLLKKVDWTGNSAEVVAEGVATAASIAEKRETEKDKRAKEAKDLADAAVEKVKTAKEAAQKAVDDAQEAVDLAKSDLEEYEKIYTGEDRDKDKVLALQLAVRQAEFKLGLAKAKQDKLVSSGGGALPAGNTPGGHPAADDPAGENAKTTATTTVFGPLLYAVNETAAEGLTLKPMFQKAYYTVSLPQGAEGQPTILPLGQLAPQIDEHGNGEIILSLSAPVKAPLLEECVLLQGNRKLATPPITLEPENKVKVVLHGMPAGVYQLKLALDWKPGEPAAYNVHFKIVLPK